jgi:DNA-binding transcriptional regulator/RsmH inhibitor MraZ
MSADGKQNQLPLGTYRRILDQKLRMTIPGIWREPPIFKDDTGFMTLRRPCRLVLLPHDLVIPATRGKFKPATKKEKEAIRIILTTLHTVMLDTRGRITIPYDLGPALELKHGDTMIVTSSGGWVEIWPSKEWERGGRVYDLFNQRTV